MKRDSYEREEKMGLNNAFADEGVPMGTMEITLSMLKPGQKGRVKKVAAQGELKRRLYDMGCTSGAQVEFVKKAPLGDPIEIVLRGYRLSLRKSEADMVTIEVQGEKT